MVYVAIVLSLVIPTVLLLVASQWLKRQFPQLARHALKEMGQDFLVMAQGKLEVERERGHSDLKSEQQAVEHAVRGLESQLNKYEQLMKGFESDRDQKYGKLEGELKRVIGETDKLQQTTSNLVAVLGNSRVRGQWGQRMANDILRSCGLQEGIHYHQEKELESGRPDYTFFLPEDHNLFMDVKFPLDNYGKLVGSTLEEEQHRYRDAFIKDVREHIREMERRDYLAQSERSVDYILIFIPNEQVYSFVNELMPSLIDDCLKKKTILCGPWTLYAIVRIIWQAWENYRYSRAIQDIVRAINGFMQDYGKFKERFEDLKDRIDKVSLKYQEISEVSFRRLDNRIQHIEEYRKGQRIPEGASESEQVILGETSRVESIPTPSSG